MNNKRKYSNPGSELYHAILTLSSPEECYQFFSDLCTGAEMKAMEQRYEVARMLSEGKIYNEILAETNASSATISRVNRSLINGEGAYEMVFRRLKEKK